MRPLLLALALLLAACAPPGGVSGSLAQRAERVELGMTRAQTLAIMGQPNAGRVRNSDGSGRWTYASDPDGLGGFAVGQAAGTVPGIGGAAARRVGQRIVRSQRTRVTIAFLPDGTVRTVSIQTG